MALVPSSHPTFPVAGILVFSPSGILVHLLVPLLVPMFLGRRAADCGPGAQFSLTDRGPGARFSLAIVALVPGLVMPIVALVPGYVPWRTSDCGPGAQFRYSPPIYTRCYARFSTQFPARYYARCSYPVPYQ